MFISFSGVYRLPVCLGQLYFHSIIYLGNIEQVCTAKMNLGDEVDLEDYVSRPDKISAAEVSCFICCCLR